MTGTPSGASSKRSSPRSNDDGRGAGERPRTEDPMTDLSLAYTPATTLAGLIREKRVSPVEVVQNSLARIEEVNGRAQCVLLHLSRGSAGSRTGGRARGRGGGAARAAPRRAHRHQGPDADQGQAHHARLPDLRELGAGFRRAHRRAPARRRQHPGGQDHDARVRLRRLLQERALGRHQQSLGHDALAGRLVRRIGRCGRDRLRANRGGDRRRRLGPHPGGLLRHRRTETDVRTHPAADAADRVRRPASLRPALANGGGRCAVSERDPGPRRSRLSLIARRA